MRRQRTLAAFFPLAFLLSWYPFILGKTHLVRTSGGINPLGPAVAALIVAGVFYGRHGIKELLTRYLPWRARLQHYAFAIVFPVTIAIAAAGLTILFGAPRPTAAQVNSWPEMLPRFVFIFLFIGLGEETGWRGFALPELQKRFSPFVASLILGVLWAAWHIPLMGIEFKGTVIPAFLISIMSGTVVLTWLFNRANGGLLPVPLMHATVNTVGAGYIFRMFAGAENTKLWWIYSLLWVIAAVSLVVTSPMMTQQPDVLATSQSTRGAAATRS